VRGDCCEWLLAESHILLSVLLLCPVCGGTGVHSHMFPACRRCRSPGARCKRSLWKLWMTCPRTTTAGSPLPPSLALLAESVCALSGACCGCAMCAMHSLRGAEQADPPGRV
jgi:hypothetical protein